MYTCIVSPGHPVDFVAFLEKKPFRIFHLKKYMLCYCIHDPPSSQRSIRSYSMASVMTNLEAIVQAYLQDTEFQQARQIVAEKRLATIPHYKSITDKFIDSTYTLDEF